MSGDYAISVTLKGDSNPPWIVVYGNDPDEVEAKVRSIKDGPLPALAAEAAADYRDLVNIAFGFGASEVQDSTTAGDSATVTQGPWKGGNGAASQSTSEAPKKYSCHHGDRRYVFLKKRNCDAYFCPLEDKSRQCDPVFEDHDDE